MKIRGARVFGWRTFLICGAPLFPERLAHFTENFPATQFCCVLENRSGGLVVQTGSVTKNHQRVTGKLVCCSRVKTGAIAVCLQVGFRKEIF